MKYRVRVHYNYDLERTLGNQSHYRTHCTWWWIYTHKFDTQYLDVNGNQFGATCLVSKKKWNDYLCYDSTTNKYIWIFNIVIYTYLVIRWGW